VLAFSSAPAKKKLADVFPGPDPFKVDFQNQNLQGQLGGVIWEFRSGKAKISGSDPDLLEIEMLNEEIVGICNQPAFAQEHIFFRAPYQVGIFPLGPQVVSHTQTVGFVRFFISPNTSTLAVQGAVDIQAIDTINQVVTGRMDIWANDTNFADGHFTLTFCQ